MMESPLCRRTNRQKSITGEHMAKSRLDEELKAGKPEAVQVYTPEVLGKTYIGDTIANDADSVVGESCRPRSVRS